MDVFYAYDAKEVSKITTASAKVIAPPIFSFRPDTPVNYKN
jgi:hypothetical protein